MPRQTHLEQAASELVRTGSHHPVCRRYPCGRPGGDLHQLGLTRLGFVTRQQSIGILFNPDWIATKRVALHRSNAVRDRAMDDLEFHSVAVAVLVIHRQRDARVDRPIRRVIAAAFSRF